MHQLSDPKTMRNKGIILQNEKETLIHINLGCITAPLKIDNEDENQELQKTKASRSYLRRSAEKKRSSSSVKTAKPH